jgi:hypothetical protein
VAQRTGAAASAKPEAREQGIRDALDERVGALTRWHRCTAPRRCTDHSALVKQETGVSIDDPALRELGLGRVVPVLLASHAKQLTWMWDAAASLNEIAKRLDAIAEAAPDDVNVPAVRDGWVAEVRALAMQTAILARGFAQAHAHASPSSPLFLPGATPMDDLARAARAARRWVREQAPTCGKPWQVVAAILVHHGWEITGATLAHQADSLRQLVRRRAV